MIELSFAVFAPVACAATGAILVANGLSQARMRRGATRCCAATAPPAGSAASAPASRGASACDPALVRLAFVVATAAGGLGVALYALGWLVIPAGDAPPGERRLPSGRGAVEVALGTGLLLLSVLLTFRGLGIWFSDAIVWPLVLIASGGALIWRGSTTQPRRPASSPPRARRCPRQHRSGEAPAPVQAAAPSRAPASASRSWWPPASPSSRPPARSAPPATWCSPCSPRWWCSA